MFADFHATIGGYAHQPGVRNVSRVDRCQIRNPPADAPSRAFVLDMVVESDGSGAKYRRREDACRRIACGCACVTIGMRRQSV